MYVGALQTSVVIVNWNGAHFLPALLQSIELQRVSQIVVVDNHSSDDSLQVLRQFPSVQVLANTENVGYGSAANQGIEICHTPYVMLLNVDVVAHPRSVEILEEYLNSHSDVAVAAPQLLFEDGKLQPSLRTFPSPFSLALYLSYLDRIVPSGYRLPAKEHGQLREVDQPMGAALMIRKSVLDEVGFFDPKFFLYMEEVDLCYRIKQKGFKIVYLPEAKMTHLAGGSSEQAWERSQRNFFDSTFRYFRNHFPESKARMLRFLLPPALAFRSLVLLFGGRFRQSKFYLKEAWRSWRLGG